MHAEGGITFTTTFLKPFNFFCASSVPEKYQFGSGSVIPSCKSEEKSSPKHLFMATNSSPIKISEKLNLLITITSSLRKQRASQQSNLEPSRQIQSRCHAHSLMHESKIHRRPLLLPSPCSLSPHPPLAPLSRSFPSPSLQRSNFGPWILTCLPCNTCPTRSMDLIDCNNPPWILAFVQRPLIDI